MVNVVYCGNCKMFDGVLLSTLSMARRTKEDLHIYFLTMEFSDINPAFFPLYPDQGSFIDSVLKKYNPNNVFEIIDCKKVYDRYIGENPNETSAYSPYTLLRLIIDQIPGIPPKIIYLDCDTMIHGDIAELYNVDINDKEFGVVHDYMGKIWLKADYFNAGVMLLNIPVIKETQVFKVSLEKIKSKKMMFSDQTVLNEFKSRFIYLPCGYRFNEQRKLRANTIVKHFCKQILWTPFFRIVNIKQRNIEGVHKILKIHDFDEDFAIYQDLISKFNFKEINREKDADEKYIITIENLKKAYNDVVAVDDISFKVKRGSLFAFLGINGAGKSTTINIIAQILRKDSGRIIIDGHDLDKYGNFIKQRIGIVFQNSVLDDILTVEENLSSRINFYNMSKTEKEEKLNRVYDLLSLRPILHRQVKKLSGGQRRRVDIARSMVHNPSILMLDEPTTGLDPKTRLTVWSLIDKIRQETGMTVFLTTHYLEEAEKASDVVILNKGKIIAEGTPNDLKNKYSYNSILLYAKKSEEIERHFINYEYSYNDDLNYYQIIVKDNDDVLNFLNNNKDIAKDFEIKKGNMDDVFLNVTSMKMEGNDDNGKK